MSKIRKILNKKNKSKIVCLTAYSKNISEEIDKYVDITLVGDSLGSVLYNYSSTRKVTLTEMINHSKSVRLGVKKSLMVVDMPFKTYTTKNIALKNAKKILKETKCDAIKIENNPHNLNIVKAFTKSKINVMGHIGFTPQFKKKFKVEGKNKIEQNNLLKNAKKIEGAGAFSIVLECIEKKTAQKITKCLKIPTIGIGSSNMCDGQILVTDDMLGLSGFYPKFVKKYANLQKTIDKAIKQFDKEVKLNKFPQGKNSF